jgi:hypothetical protein
MAAELILAPEAERDIAEGYAWYEAQRAGLGEEFLSCVDACFQSVCRAPEAHPTVYDGYRRALVRRFPFAVLNRPGGAEGTRVFETRALPFGASLNGAGSGDPTNGFGTAFQA